MTEYSASSIRVLKDLEPVKERPGMYTRTTCPTHIVQEVIDNAADEALGGFAKKISVLMRADGIIEVSDNGRGIPVEIHPEEGRPAVELVFCKLHAGGKFNKKEAGNAYRFSGGLPVLRWPQSPIRLSGSKSRSSAAVPSTTSLSAPVSSPSH